MGRKKKKQIIILSLTLLAIILCTSAYAYYLFFASQYSPATSVKIYIDKNDTPDSVFNKIKEVGHPKNMKGFYLLAKIRKYQEHLHTGCYSINKDDNAFSLYNRLSRGHQSPVNITVSSVRSLTSFAKNLSSQLMIDSAEIATLVNDSNYQRTLGYSKETILALFIPNTYEVYWNITPEKLIQRLKNEHDVFWNSDRIKKSEKVGLTPIQVCTLASIVDEETNNTQEKPLVAGLYLNRLKINMPLQADPTIRFALQDFSIKRILSGYLAIDSPYNTYKFAGLPPGPIRIASTAGIDAVLNYARHDYLYMCAKEDFSGTHNFAQTFAEHMRNAKRYQQALNQRKIYK